MPGLPGQRITLVQLSEFLEFGKTMEMGNKATYGWDDAKECTVLQLIKEEAHDYRYFPEPDLVPIEMIEEWLNEIKSTNDANDSDMCTACQEREPDAACNPCGHASFCFPCLNQWMIIRGTCPICRTEMISAIKLYP